MAQVAKIKGMEQFKKNLNRHRSDAARGFHVGLKKGGLLLQAESMKMVPVDTGNLKASAFTRASGTGFRTNVRVGYTAAYAVYVHEAPMKLQGQRRKGKQAKGAYWDPQGRASNKFLERPYREKRKEILNEVGSEMKKAVARAGGTL